MPSADSTPGSGDGWHPQAAYHSRAPDTSAPWARSPAPEGDLAGILRRAAGIGIPAWRVTTALGIPLPVRNQR
jgi:hypothetical protein